MTKKTAKPDNPEQSKRFLETAEKVGADDEGVLDRVLEKITAKRPKESRRQSDQ